jgi:hypothetical protein
VAVCLPRLLHCSTSTIAPSWPRPSTEGCLHPHIENILFRRHSMVLAPGTGTGTPPYLVYHPILYPILSSHAPRSCLQRSCLEPHPHLHYLVLNHTRVSTPNPVSPYAGSVCAVSLYVGMPSRGPRSQYSVSLCVVSLCVVLVCLCVLCCCVVSLYGDMPMIAGSLYVGMPSIKPPCKDWTRTERQGFGGGLWTQLGTDDAHT